MNRNKSDMPRSLWRRRLKLGIPLLLLAVGTYYMRDVIEANWNYNSLYKAALEEGAFVTPADLRTRYGARDEENAAPILKPIFARTYEQQGLQSYRDVVDFATTTSPFKRLKPSLQDLPMEQALAVLEKQLAGIERCLTKPKCDFHYNYQLNASLMFPELAAAKGIEKVISLRARLLAQSGKYKEAGDKFGLGLHLAKLIGDTPSLFSVLTRIALEATVFQQMELAATARPADSSLRECLRSAMAYWGGPIDPRQASAFELFSSWDTATHTKELLEVGGESQEADDLGYFRRLTYVPGVTRAWRARSLEWITEYHRALRLSNGDPIRFSGLQQGLYRGDDEEGLSNVLFAILHPVFTQATAAMIKSIANHELCLSTLDLLDERQKLGHWPTQLPVERRDPFGQKTLRYVVNGEHARVWSVGPDYKDSGGKNKEEDRDSDDLSVTL